MSEAVAAPPRMEPQESPLTGEVREQYETTEPLVPMAWNEKESRR